MQTNAQATMPPSAWRRVITAGIALTFLGLGAFLVAYAATVWSDRHDAGWGYFFGGMSMFLGLPFAIATVLPFGRLRRILIGVGAALLGLVVVPSVALAPGLGAIGGPLILLAAAALFYIGYRIAR